MRELIVYEKELDDISLLNSLSAWCFTAASGSIFFVIGLIVDALMQSPISDMGKGAIWIAVPIGAVLGIGFIASGTWAWLKKRSNIEEIKSQAVEIEQQPLLPSLLQSAPDIPNDQPSTTPEEYHDIDTDSPD